MDIFNPTTGEILKIPSPDLSGYVPKTQFADIKRQGVVDRAETTFAFDGTNTFTLTSVGATWSYYRAGLKYTITGNKTVVIPGTPIASGTWFIYIDDTIGTLTASQTVWTLQDTKVPIATINFNDSLTPKYWTSDERHSALIDGYMQYYLHNVDGARSLNTPTLSGYTTNTDTNVAKTFSISAGTLVDQDIVHSLASLPDPDGTATDYVVWYRTGASTWAWKLSNMPFLYNTSTDWIQYDNGGTPTDLTGGGGALARYTNSYLLLTNKSGASRFVITPGRGVFTSLAAAQAESVGTFTWDGFPIAESVIVYQLTWSTVTSTSQGKCILAAEPKLVNISTVTNNSSGAGTDHNTLSNLQGGTLGEYYHLTSAEKTNVANLATTYVPYTGATGDVDIGTHEINVNSLRIDYDQYEYGTFRTHPTLYNTISLDYNNTEISAANLAIQYLYLGTDYDYGRIQISNSNGTRLIIESTNYGDPIGLDLSGDFSCRYLDVLTTSNFRNTASFRMAYDGAYHAPIYIEDFNVDVTSPLQGELWSNGRRLVHCMRTGGIVNYLSGCVFQQTASKTVANTTSETTLITTGLGTVTIPNGLFSIGKTIEIEAEGTIANTGTPTIQIKFKLGSTAVIDTTAVAMVTLGGTSYWKAKAKITCRTIGSSGTFMGQGDFTYANGTAPVILADNNTTTSTINTDTTQVLDVTAQWGTASASNTITCTNLIVKLI